MALEMVAAAGGLGGDAGPVAVWPAMSAGRPRGARGGRREDLGFYVRSGWEANWVRYLKWLQERGEIASWAYEPETFEFSGIKRGSRFYTPDFRVVQNDGSMEYHEVKGYMRPEAQTKLKRMAKYHPEIVIKLIDAPSYRAVARQMRGVIPHWEGE